MMKMSISSNKNSSKGMNKNHDTNKDENMIKEMKLIKETTSEGSIFKNPYEKIYDDKIMCDYSIVIPIFNEEKNVKVLFNEIKDVMRKVSNSYEVIFVNDGSTDNSLDVLKKINDKHLKVINFAANYGQSCAFDAGFRFSKGRFVVTMDGDLQNNPKDIIRLINNLKGYDTVVTYRKKRADSRNIRLISRIGNWLINVMLNEKIHDHSSSLRIYKRVVVKNLKIFGELHRFIPSLILIKGFKINEIEVVGRKRIYGKSKYNSLKAFRTVIDLMYVRFIKKHSKRPFLFFGTWAIIGFLVSLISFGYSLSLYFRGTFLRAELWLLIGLVSLGLGFLMFFLGFIYQMYLNMDRKPQYIVKSIFINGKEYIF